jgi:hypothetical protein
MVDALIRVLFASVSRAVVTSPLEKMRGPILRVHHDDRAGTEQGGGTRDRWGQGSIPYEL